MVTCFHSHTHTHTHTNTHTHTHTLMHSVHTHTHTHTCIHTHSCIVYTHTHTCIHTYSCIVSTHTHKHADTHIHACIHTYIRTHSCSAHTHTLTWKTWSQLLHVFKGNVDFFQWFLINLSTLLTWCLFCGRKRALLPSGTVLKFWSVFCVCCSNGLTSNHSG